MPERDRVPARQVAGVLNIDKPAGWTSFDVVNFIRRRTGVQRVGHAGTLDPAATGVLPILLGNATRLAEYLVDATKAYAARIQLGVETDTYDAEGEVVRRSDASGITRDDVQGVLSEFEGELLQTPPAYSAIKLAGVPLYKLARAGHAVDLEPRKVRIDRLTMDAFDPPFLELDIECSKGFYVRSLAHDIGARLGCGAMLASLVRGRAGPFHLEDAVTIETLTPRLEDGTWEEFLYAADELLIHWRAAIVAAPNATRIEHGRPLEFNDEEGVAQSGELCRAYNLEGEFLAVLQRDDRLWRPVKVFTG